MNHHLDPKKTGLAVGTLVGGWHLLWALLVAVGWAQGFINFILWAHMVSLPVAINTFDPSVAAVLVIVTGAFGYAAGFIFALMCNYLCRNTTPVPAPDVSAVL